ncbi:MAG: 50S ribosomal protein L5 [Sulfobacillus benefaciens]|jgi:large subunit ribosomal protein L5|uniref:Large ribosomal subunit protein uL5 n=1 Tax=Sulfobacillus benefaciens TaxID=453960 RepID=A0A2T2X7R0_9FIRM|nr:MAG: 50S ribosomal protein L5 [Sulfobacillus benefaciens]HBQ94153.1 50S ribosomal protein L5 [Sulfobacillus sp.]
MAVVSELRNRYDKEVVPKLQERFKYKNPMVVPKVVKVVINMGVGDSIGNPKLLEAAVNDLATITGQHPLVTRARKSIASFKVREGMPIGVKVTLRGQRMYDFVEKLFFMALPRVRDFRGVSTKGFDGRGNYTLGIREQIIFPEIEYDKVEKVRGMDVTLVTSAQTDEEAKELLTLLGMPFTPQR